MALTVPGGSGPADTYTYSDYGAPQSGSWLAYQYAGYRYDSETGLYYMPARYYSPTLGRFLQADPSGVGGGFNLYAYAGNDPVNQADPTGLSPDGGGLTIKLSETIPGAFGTQSLNVSATGTTCGFNTQAFANALDSNAAKSPTGGIESVKLCGRYVGWALSAGGANVGSHDGGAYGPYLLQAGFHAVSSAGYTPQQGDVAIFQMTTQHEHGHAAGYDGKQWVSDFFQGVNPNPYRVQSSAGAKTIYRSGCQ